MNREAADLVARPFVVVVNGEGQYSVWKNDEAVPAGWRCTPWSGTHAECLARIVSVWTDIRPVRPRLLLEQLRGT